MKTIELNVKGINLSLQIVEQHEKEFKQWIPLEAICSAVGLIGHKQLARVKKDPKFSCHQLVGTGFDGKNYRMWCIPSEQVVGFLYSVNIRKSQKPAVAKRLLHFQKYLQKAMNQVIFGDISAEVIQELREALSDLRNKYMELENRQNAIASVTDLNTSDLASFGGRAMARKRHRSVLH
jgi:hypothetical protein